MFEYHLSFSNGLFYAFAFDMYKRPAGHFKSIDFYEVVSWITERENIQRLDFVEAPAVYSISSYGF